MSSSSTRIAWPAYGREAQATRWVWPGDETGPRRARLDNAHPATDSMPALMASEFSAHGSRRPPPRIVEFAAYTWQVKTSASAVGPGPNHFSDSPDNVWVDGRGRLHMKVTYSNGRWYCAEVINTGSLGRGCYSFHLASRVDNLDPSVVLGLFTWSDDPAYNNREIDIEFSRWATADDGTNGQYAVQPYDHIGHVQRFTQRTVASSTPFFEWSRAVIRFGNSSATPSTWTYRGHGVPEPGSEHVRMNLWLNRGAPPTNGRPVEVVVDSFKFTPARNPGALR